MPQVPATTSDPSDPSRIQHLLLFWKFLLCLSHCFYFISFFDSNDFLKHISDDKIVCFGFSSKCFKFQATFSLCSLLFQIQKREWLHNFKLLQNILSLKISFKILGFACLWWYSRILIYITLLLTSLSPYT